MEYFKLVMVRPHLENIPVYHLPERYQFKLFEDQDEIHWAAVETAAGEFQTLTGALKHFDKEFSGHLEEMKKRCVFLLSPDGEVVGTTTAWLGEFQGISQGRLHWVAIKPSHQGRGLAKPMLSYALSIMAKYHYKAYLTTQTTSWKAVRMYLDFGFEPARLHNGDQDYQKGWELIRQLAPDKQISY